MSDPRPSKKELSDTSHKQKKQKDATRGEGTSPITAPARVDTLAFWEGKTGSQARLKTSNIAFNWCFRYYLQTQQTQVSKEPPNSSAIRKHIREGAKTTERNSSFFSCKANSSRSYRDHGISVNCNSRAPQRRTFFVTACRKVQARVRNWCQFWAILTEMSHTNGTNPKIGLTALCVCAWTSLYICLHQQRMAQRGTRVQNCGRIDKDVAKSAKFVHILT